MVKAQTIQIHWHDKQPIFSVQFHPTVPGRFLTTGGDGTIRIWEIQDCESDERCNDNGSKIQQMVIFKATLSRHLQSVNCARWSPARENDIIASCSDDGMILIWKLATRSSPIPNRDRSSLSSFQEESHDDNEEEAWSVVASLRLSDTEDIYDLAWSPDGHYIICGLTDNTVQIWNVGELKRIKIIREHRHFVQGVAWDPLNRYLLSQSSDRTAKIWSIQKKYTTTIPTTTTTTTGSSNYTLAITGASKLHQQSIIINNNNLDSTNHHHQEAVNNNFTFYDETLVTFFRRCQFSPEGSMAIFPTGTYEGEACFYIVPRSDFYNPTSSMIFQGFDRGVVAVGFNPRLFQHGQQITTKMQQSSTEGDDEMMFMLPYRMIYAVISQQSLHVFDTVSREPLFGVNSMHFGTLTDLSWSLDGYRLMVTATDGFASLIECTEDDLGSTIDIGIQDELVHNLRCRHGMDLHVQSVKFPTEIITLQPASSITTTLHNNNNIDTTLASTNSIPTTTILQIKRKQELPT